MYIVHPARGAAATPPPPSCPAEAGKFRILGGGQRVWSGQSGEGLSTCNIDDGASEINGKRRKWIRAGAFAIGEEQKSGKKLGKPWKKKGRPRGGSGDGTSPMNHHPAQAAACGDREPLLSRSPQAEPPLHPRKKRRRTWRKRN